MRERFRFPFSFLVVGARCDALFLFFFSNIGLNIIATALDDKEIKFVASTTDLLSPSFPNLNAYR